MLTKQAVPINFAQGLDTKTDKFQVALGKFLALSNSVFTNGFGVQKRNGYGPLPSLLSAPEKVTTFNGNLTAIGSSVEALSDGSSRWVDKGFFTPISLSVLPASRSAVNQTQCDSVTAPNGLSCTVYTEVANGVSSYKYLVQDSTTGQNITLPAVIPVSAGVVTGSPRVFLLGGYFIVVFTNVIGGVSHLQYVAVSTSNPSIVTANADIASAYTPAGTVAWDGVVFENKLYVAYNTIAGGQQIKVTYLSTSFVVAAPQSFAGSIATIFGLCADATNPASPVIYISFYDVASRTGFVAAVDQNLNKVMLPTAIITVFIVGNITCTAQNGVVGIVYEVINPYSYDIALFTNFLNLTSVSKPATVTTGTVGSTVNFIKSLGLASKAFLMNDEMYMLGVYSSTLQKTYFLLDIVGNIIAKFAYENGGGYLLTGLPQAEVIGSSVKIAYLYKDLIQSVATSLGSQGAPNTANIYSQTGVNVATIDFSPETLSVSEIGANLNISGGIMWAYDGQTLNEQGFNLFPDNIELTGSGAGGSMTADTYYYRVTYEWTDSQGNIFRSAPSVPLIAVTAGATSSVTLHIPTLRLTYKSGVKIVIYRWSVTNETYYQITSITAPTLNDKSVDSITYVDTQADSSIVGNSILYTTGGVIENIGPPAATATTLFDDRIWLIDAEDRNLLWYSKQVIEGTPVEMSDLFTIYVAPTTGSQGSTGPLRCLSPLDDKLILFKDNAIYYINGSGPDNTGTGSQYSQPIFVTSTVGCANQNSIVFMPNGLMFQSDKGIWILKRDLSTDYIGAPVEAFNQYTVNSAVNVPGTNQVRFTLSSGVTLMYDYYYGQWGTFDGVPAVSSTLYQGLHTYVSSSGSVSQETPGKYLDNGNPVLLSFTTSWLNLAGLQGYQRAYFFYLLGQYFTPHKINLTIAYDYNSSPIQSILISPDNFSQSYGGSTPYGQESSYGGPGDIEQWRIFLTKQRCQAFQITLNELYDPSFGVPAGQGLSISGLNLVVALKKGFRPISSANSAGGVS